VLCKSLTHLLTEFYQKVAEKGVMGFDLKAGMVLDEVTSDDILFRVSAVGIGKARSPITRRRVVGTANAEVEDDSKQCLYIGHWTWHTLCQCIVVFGSVVSVSGPSLDQTVASPIIPLR